MNRPALRDTTLARIRLRHLQCFLAVAQRGSLRAAAQALSITQPAVTKTLQELEELLGTQLFVRGRKGAVLTAEAEVFLVHANASLHALGQAVDSVQGDAGEAPVELGVLPTLATSFLPPVIHAFAALRPGTPLRVHTARNRQLIEMLRGREVDLVIGRLSDPEAMAGVSFEHLVAEPLALVLRKGHRAASARRKLDAAGLAALSALPKVLPLSGTMIRQVADAFFARHGIAPGDGLVETLDTALARALVLGGDALWATPLGAAQPDIDAGLMVRLDVAITPHEPVGLMLRTDAPASAALRALLALVRQQARRRAAPRKINRR
ncbi:MAG TPA: LysR substrate-binding domain-containing protein [Albitalea sp.]|uniref:LysR substrate-binding domain-containing protein n=1 Tax=Piscinibacter sp. TaxID=1903157 RepID=UPI002ED3A689